MDSLLSDMYQSWNKFWTDAISFWMHLSFYASTFLVFLSLDEQCKYIILIIYLLVQCISEWWLNLPVSQMTRVEAMQEAQKNIHTLWKAGKPQSEIAVQERYSQTAISKIR